MMPASGASDVTRYYFYLSYAHSAPLVADSLPDSDHWVGILFKDLSREVAAMVGARGGNPVGYFDDLVRPGADWKTELAGVLGATDVFVALYSPGYFNKSWPLQERESFRRRFDARAGDDADQRVLPVLWVPLHAHAHAAERAAALSLGAGIPEYAENGLRALCRLAAYQEQYRTILVRLARRIVEIAGSARPRPGGPVTIDVPVDSAKQTDMSFAVAVLAPSRTDLPDDRSASPYGGTARSWQPYRDVQKFPIAEYAANVAERLGLPTRIVDWRSAVRALADSPTLVLIDPWIADTPGGTAALAALSADLPEWVTPLLVADRRDPQYAGRGTALIAEVADRLGAQGRRVRRILNVEQLVRVMPSLINDTCRRYLKNAPVSLPKGSLRALPRIAPGEGTDD
jgi:FxsC-like protein